MKVNKSALDQALRQKFRTPKDALRALGIDAKVIGDDDDDTALDPEVVAKIYSYLGRFVDDDTLQSVKLALSQFMPTPDPDDDSEQSAQDRRRRRLAHDDAARRHVMSRDEEARFAARFPAAAKVGAA